MFICPSLAEVLFCKQSKGHSPLTPYSDFSLCCGLQKHSQELETLILYKKQECSVFSKFAPEKQEKTVVG